MAESKDQLDSAFEEHKRATIELRLRIQRFCKEVLGLAQLKDIDIYVSYQFLLTCISAILIVVKNNARSFQGLETPEIFEMLVKLIGNESSIWRAKIYQRTEGP
ncbi:hypothetical protein IQ07DRAFT_583035 [Pyrenochaeta sp. DS3sAY3a]|nr:hypothetical protein IQ07DRAFT_583035 [Pyrenochaeta sp. DS3sAY3a]